MRKMIDSGIPGIGMIPEEWKTSKVKYLFTSGKGLSITKADLIEEGLPVISYGQIHSKQNNGIEVKPELLRYTDMKYKHLNPLCKIMQYDFAFADTSEDYEGCGNCVYKRDDKLLFGGYHVVILHALGKRDNRYYAYLFQSDEWRKQIRENASGVKVFSITQKIIMNTNMICPPFKEQQKIADFLDSKCSEIDALIQNLQGRKEGVKEYRKAVITEAVTKGLDKDAEMKDSGIDWIGEIPEGWSISKFKAYIKSVTSGVSAVTNDISEDSGKFILRTSAVSSERFLKSEVKSVTKLAEKRLICPVEGDTVIMSRMNTSEMVGACAYIDKDYKDLYIPDKLWKVKFNKILSSKYAWYLINSQPIRGWFSSISTGTSASMQNISISDFYNTYAPFPPLSEQHRIADYLDAKCSEIDTLLQNYDEQITALEEYKKSLIYEYVTGKKEVPEP